MTSVQITNIYPKHVIRTNEWLVASLPIALLFPFFYQCFSLSEGGIWREILDDSLESDSDQAGEVEGESENESDQSDSEQNGSGDENGGPEIISNIKRTCFSHALVLLLLFLYFVFYILVLPWISFRSRKTQNKLCFFNLYVHCRNESAKCQDTQQGT